MRSDGASSGAPQCGTLRQGGDCSSGTGGRGVAAWAFSRVCLRRCSAARREAADRRAACWALRTKPASASAARTRSTRYRAMGPEERKYGLGSSESGSPSRSRTIAGDQPRRRRSETVSRDGASDTARPPADRCEGHGRPVCCPALGRSGRGHSFRNGRRPRTGGSSGIGRGVDNRSCTARGGTSSMSYGVRYAVRRKEERRRGEPVHPTDHAVTARGLVKHYRHTRAPGGSPRTSRSKPSAACSTQRNR